MKKSLIAFAVLSAFASVASAQSSVVLYGVVDASTNYQSNQNAKSEKSWTLESGSLSASRWGLMGSEVIDGGLKVNFKLESTLNIDNGSSGSLFDRQATVGVTTEVGSFDLGRQTNLSYDALIKVDPLNGAHLGTNPNYVLGSMQNATLYSAFGGASGARQNNSVKYMSPGVLGGIKFGAMYGFGEKTGDASASSYSGASASFSQDGLTANFAYSQSKDTMNASTLRSYAGGAKFVVNSDWAVKVTYGSNEVNTTGRTLSVFGAGVDYKVSPAMTLTGAYYANRRSGDVKGEADLFAVLAKYDFSKRTAVYTSFTKANAKTVAAADTELGMFIGTGNKSANRLTVGMMHAF